MTPDQIIAALLATADRDALTAGDIIHRLRRNGYRIVSTLVIEERPSDDRRWCLTRRGRLTIDTTILSASQDLDRSMLAEPMVGFDVRSYADTRICEDLMHALLPILRSTP